MSLTVLQCDHGNGIPTKVIAKLEDHQGGFGRHKCVTCAYNEGILAGSTASNNYELRETCPHNRTAPVIMLQKLPESQAGPGRHKCAVCAFYLGFYSSVSYPEFLKPKITVVKKLATKLKLGGAEPIEFTSIRNIGKRELLNKRIGFDGEVLVLEYEKIKLRAAGRTDLAERILHVSKDRGDGFGYDILSYDPNGKKKYIEVKTTTMEDSPFFVTRREISFSKMKAKNFFLYRLFNFQKMTSSANLFILSGDLQLQLKLEPILFLAGVK